jgi:hypothetical protein
MNDKENKNASSDSTAHEGGGIIYNVTFKVDILIADVWLRWLLQEHIPEIMQTKCFADYKVVRLLDVDDTEGPTYAVQYSAHSKADYNRYREMYLPGVNKRSFEKWGEQFFSFGSVMEVLK